MEARFRHGITITRKKKVKIAGYKFTILWKNLWTFSCSSEFISQFWQFFSELSDKNKQFFFPLTFASLYLTLLTFFPQNRNINVQFGEKKVSLQIVLAIASISHNFDIFQNLSEFFTIVRKTEVRIMW